MATADQSEGQKIINIVADFKLPGYLGWQLAFQLLPGWTADSVSDILNRVEGIDDFPQLRTVNRKQTWTNPRSWKWIKPPWELMQQSARETKALCINARGEFALLDEGFFAISHAGIEGLYEDESNRGLPLSVIDQLLKLTKPLNAQWLWIDSLSIPAGRRDLNVAEERLKNELINMMTNIYGNATGVIVLDAMVMNMLSDQPLHIAIALLCGRWSRRMWTFQEGRLARRISILTKTASIDLHDLLGQMRAFQTQKDVSKIVRFLETLTGNTLRPSLSDIAQTFFSRDAGLFLDYARSLFPVLNLKWDDRYTRDEAMAVLFNTYRKEAAALVCSHGSARLIDGPGWLPASLSGIRMTPIFDAIWTSKGLLSTWYVYRIRSVGRHETTQVSLELEFDFGGKKEFTCWAFSTGSEREKSRAAFINKVNQGEGVLLSPTSLEPMKYAKFLGKYAVVLLAVRMPPQEKVFQVCLTAQIFYLENIGPGEKLQLTLSHQSPLQVPNPEQKSKANFEQAFRTDLSVNTPKSDPLHKSVRDLDFQSLKRVLNAQPIKDTINARDINGWTLLHWAVSTSDKRATSVVATLIKRGAKVNPSFHHTKPPLLLAVELAHEDVIELLLRRGASVQAARGITPLAQALFSRRSQRVLSLLISHGANVNEAVYGTPPVWLAQKGDLAYLLSHGADPNAKHPAGPTLLHDAAYYDEPDTVSLLVQHGATVDTLQSHSGLTALYYAVDRQNLASVERLLKLQANANFRTKDGFPLIVLAASGGLLSIVQALLSAGAKADVCTDKQLWTPLHVAVKDNRFANLNLLLEQVDSKFTIWRKDKDGMTAMDLAAKLERRDMVTLLQRRTKDRDSSPATHVGEGRIFYLLLVVVLILFAILNYSTCARPRLDGEMLWEYCSRLLFSRSLLPLKLLVAIVSLGLISNILETRRQNLLRSDAFNRSWTNKPDQSKSTMLGVGVLVLYAAGVFYLGPSLNTVTSAAIVLTVSTGLVWASRGADENRRRGFRALSVYVVGVPLLNILADVGSSSSGAQKSSTMFRIAVAAIGSSVPASVGLYTIAASHPDRNSFVSSPRGIALGVVFWLAIATTTFLLGWQLLAITILIVSSSYFAALTLRAITGRQLYVEAYLRVFVFGCFGVSVVLTWLHADLVLDVVCILCLTATARDVYLFLSNFPLHRPQRERKGGELKFELSIASAAVVRTADMLRRSIGLVPEIVYTSFFTCLCVLMWLRETNRYGSPGANVAPYVLAVCVAWGACAMWLDWIAFNASNIVVAVALSITIYGLLALFKIGERKIRSS